MVGALSMLVNTGSDCAGNQTPNEGQASCAVQVISTGAAASDVCCVSKETEEWQRDRPSKTICYSLLPRPLAVVMEGWVVCGAARLQQGCCAAAALL
jgi:hypothetical protein